MTDSIVRKLKKTRLKSDHNQHKLSAILLLRGKPIACGFNYLKKTHPMMKKYSDVKTLHAEVDAILKVKDRSILPDCTLVVYREDRYGNPALSKPCPVCTEIIKDCGIDDVIYSTASGWANL